MTIASLNPTTGKKLREFSPLSAVEIEKKLTAAGEAFANYRQAALSQRAGILLQAAEILETNVDAFARTITLEMGKPIGAARDEVRKCASACRYFAENGERFLEGEKIQTAAARSSIQWEPLGVVLAVMPWNFPFWQVFRF